jgi:phosphoglucosamine mutase
VTAQPDQRAFSWDMTHRLFGTDGVRGKAGTYPLDAPTIARLGGAIVRALPHAAGHRVLIGRDTRESGPWIERELVRGARSTGASVTLAGVLPTPAIAFLTQAMGFDCGVVISASHNPYDDNGIKVFSGEGEKLDDTLEAHIETTMADLSWAVGAETGPPPEAHDFALAYISHARAALPDTGALRGSSVVIDCANGATSPVAPRLFRDLGFDVTVLADQPDGRNINLHCGSTHLDLLRRAVTAGGHRLGIAFDGDGDRCLIVDHAGQVVDGDAILMICAIHLKRRGELRGDEIVATVMSNIGLELALARHGIGLRRTPVGDKYVMAELMARDLSLGGEQSGHVIFTDFLYTGDGIVTALNVLRVMAETGRDAADLAAAFVRYPQVLVNVRVQEKRDLASVPGIASAVADLERRLKGEGRLLVRYSGTEPLLRIMIEGRDQAQIDAWAHGLATVVQEHLGAPQ